VGVLFTNNASTTLSAAISSTSATSISVASSSTFPAPGAGEYFYATIDDGSNIEIVKVTAVSGTTWTVVRGSDNTTAATFANGTTVQLRAAAALLTDIQQNIAAKSANQTVYNATTASSATSYDVGTNPQNENNAMVFLDGVMQHHDTFSFSGSTLTFDAAPSNGLKLEVIIDNLINLQSSNLTVDTFTATNGQTAFTLSDTPAAEDNLIVFIEGVFQNQDSYSISNNVLTMSAGVTTGRKVVVYVINPVNIGTPSDGTVTSAKLSGNITMPGTLTVGSNDVAFDSPTFVVDNANSRVGLGTASPSVPVDIVGDVKMSSTLDLTSHLDMPDSANIKLGTGDDLLLYHDGTNSYIANTTGALKIATETSGIAVTIGHTTSETTVADNLTVTGTITGTLATAAQTNITSLGTLTTLTVDDITINGSTISDGGEFTIDSGDDIVLDADGGDIIFKDGGTTIAHLKNDSSDLQILSIVQDKDIILRGNDGGSYLNALTLDMSDAGKAIFGGDIQIADSKYIRVGDSSDLLIYHDASHSYIEDDGTGDLRLKGGTVRLQGTGGTNLLVGSTGGATTLYHDNSAKLATSSTGVTLSGNLTMMSNVVYASQVYVHDRLGHLNDASTFINFDTDRIEFATDGEAMRITSDKKVYIGTASPSIAGILSVEGGNAGVPALYVSNTNADSLGIRSQVNNNTSNNAIYEAINTDGTQWKIRNDGDHQGTDTSIGSISDSRLKKDVSDLTYDIAKFKQYRPVEFNWINDELHRSPDSGKTRGFLAQEVGALDNYYVDKYEAEGDDIPLVDEDGMAHGTKFGYKDAMYISVIKQLITRLETAEAKIAELESS
jgi:hypothetical protein